MSAGGASAIVLDIEGTTTPIQFVYEVLFPFARARVRKYLETESGALPALYREYVNNRADGQQPPRWGASANLDEAAAYVHWLMDQDRKSTPLKQLQGEIWQEGYRSGELQSEVFEDVPAAMKRWSGQRRPIAIFSSGSVLAQKLLFAHSTAGDLTPFITAYFDTTVGPKTAAESYRHIASAMGQPSTAITFVSDVVAELDAASASGMQTVLSERPGNRPQNGAGGYKTVRSLLEVAD